MVGDSSLNQQNEHVTWELVNPKPQVALGWGSLGATGMGVDKPQGDLLELPAWQGRAVLKLSKVKQH